MTGSEKPGQIDLFAAPSASPAPRGEERRGASSRHAPRPAPRRPTAAAAAGDEALIGRLEAGGRYKVLRKLEPRALAPHLWPPRGRAPGSWPRLGIVLDTETTGLDHAAHEIIELGMVAFTYAANGIEDVVGVFSALREPAGAITAEITRITDEMVAGQRIDLDAVRDFIADADLVIAHNARFDRPFCEKLVPGFAAKPWACSVAEVDWAGLGHEGTKLGYLVGQCGYFHNGHRAVDDCHALLEVLAQPRGTDGRQPAFAQLLAAAGQARLRIRALGAPFHAKDALKARGYRWSDGANGAPKCWWREIAEDAYEDEARFLEQDVYAGRISAQVERLTACERFKA